MIDMHSKYKRKTTMAIIFTFISGYIDVLGLFAIGGMFLSFMSGNTTRLGLNLVEGNFEIAIPFIVIICSFVVGAFFGNLIKEKVKREILATILISEILLVILSLIFHCLEIYWPTYIPLTLAMGLQNAAQIEVNNVVIGKTFMSGTLYALGVSLSQVFQKKQSGMASLILFGSWFASFLGSIVGALMFSQIGLTLTLISLLVFLIILFIWIIYLEVRKKEVFIEREDITYDEKR